MLTRLICAVLRHPLEPVDAHDRGPDGRVYSLVGERCKCARRIEGVRVFGGQFPQRRS